MKEAAAPTRERLGIAASRGIAVGPAIVLERRDIGFARRKIAAFECDAEVARFEAAVVDAQASWRRTLAGVDSKRPELAILEAYVQLASDELLQREVSAQIRVHRRAAEWAVSAAVVELATRLFAVDDPYIRERGHDIEFVGRQIVRALLATASGSVEGERESLRVLEPAIVVASELSPADAAAMMTMPVLGFVTEKGSRTSHTAIMARALGIPAVLGLGTSISDVAPGQLLIVDGTRGAILLDPTDDELDAADRLSEGARVVGERLRARRAEACVTADGERVELHANIGLEAEAPLALEHGAEGIGLYRTEFLFVDRRTPPTEEEQYEAFAGVVRAMNGRPVTLRTFDLGGDKFVSSLPLPAELNPMLGLRAVRLQLARPELLLEHLVAMVRASAFGEVRVLVPMVGSVEELEAVRALLDRAFERVAARNLPAAMRLALGAMIEVPASALIAGHLASAADFLSIGSNDLVQYALAVDRGNRDLAHLATPFHPAVLRLMANVVEAGHAHDRPVSVCGEMASDPMGALLLAGLGVRSLSMEPAAIPRVKAALATAASRELRDVAARALAMPRASDVVALLREAFGVRVRDVLDASEASVSASEASVSASEASVS
ncbi:MAG: phosphoenolpyruvate--protein phosphotransferase [Deltaproteobacteria bacterium]|nr:phosphoenolpyruvate--protein phosphotransferase [Deltaproteobacteria bacterium]